MNDDQHQNIPLLFTVKQVAKILNISRSTVYTLFDTGQLGSVLVGSASRRVSENQLADYLRRIHAQKTEA
jgi:excisionase family DNA binding protein